MYEQFWPPSRCFDTSASLAFLSFGPIGSRSTLRRPPTEWSFTPLQQLCSRVPGTICRTTSSPFVSFQRQCSLPCPTLTFFQRSPKSRCASQDSMQDQNESGAGDHLRHSCSGIPSRSEPAESRCASWAHSNDPQRTGWHAR